MAEKIKRTLQSLKPESHDDTQTQDRQQPLSQGQGQGQKPSDMKKSNDLSSMPVERQFETDYDKAGNLVPDPVHFDKDQDMVGASQDDFSDH